MKLTKAIIALASAGMFLGLSGPATAQKTDSDVNSRPISVNSSQNDAHFAKEAAEGNMVEVALGKLAVQKASSNDVKQFGQRMVDDHSKANDQLMGLASKDNFSIPDRIDAKDQAMIDRLSSLTGSTFDRDYMRRMVVDHEEDIAKFQREANSGTNPDLKAWASNTLPTLQDHLHQAKNTQKAIGFVSSNRFSRK
jgi:putative membrane protein